MKFGFQEKIIAAAAALVVVVIGWYFLYYGPTSGEIDRNRREIESLRLQIQNAVTNPYLIDSLKKNIEELEVLNARNEMLILPVDSINFVNETIKEKCRLFDLTITQPISPDKQVLFSEGADTLQTGIKMVQIDLALRGSFFNIGHFIEEFPQYPFLIKAGEIEIVTDDDIYPELDAALKVYVFFRRNM